MKYDLEICVHCYSVTCPFYLAQLQYQVASLFYYCPPDVKVCLSVCTTHADERTIEYLRLASVQMPKYITLKPVILQPGFLYRRAVGRNLRALIGDARVYWFTDVDYFFGSRCFRTLLENVDETSGMVYPKIVNINPDHATGDAMTEGITPESKMFPVADLDKFVARKQSRAIGGVHIIGSNRLRETNPNTGIPYGYINGHGRCVPVDPEDGFRQCKCDPVFKRQHAPAQHVDIESVFRIRHSDAGRCFNQKGIRTVERPDGKDHD